MDRICFFDYTCAYSYRLWRWVEGQVHSVRPDVVVDWTPFSLKEVNRGGPGSIFDDTEEPGLSVLALALSIAVRAADFPAYHSAVFPAFHEGGRRVTTELLFTAADRAGLDVDAFWQERAHWIDEVAASHRRAVEHWGVFGTPTLVVDGSALYLKMAEVPGSPHEGIDLWDNVNAIAVSHPEMIEMKRPSSTS